MQSVIVKTRYYGGCWNARAGRGKAAKSASSTSTAKKAAQRAGAKYFGIDACNVIKAHELPVTEIALKNASDGHQQFRVDLPDAKGGAA